MKLIKAKEQEDVEDKKLSLIKRFKSYFKYDIKKMEVLVGKYNINKKVILSQNALLKAIIYYGVIIKTQGNMEIMGWLVGKQKNGIIEIVDSYIGNCKSTSSYTELDPLETIRLNKLAKKRGLIIVGQWHTHPGFATSPSYIDDDFMRNLEKFGVKTPVQLIVNNDDFNLSMMVKGKRKKVDFIIPPKIDTKMDINLGYINGEYDYRSEYQDDSIGVPTPYGHDYSGGWVGNSDLFVPEKDIIAFCGWVGNVIFKLISCIPYVNLRHLIIEAKAEAVKNAGN